MSPHVESAEFQPSGTLLVSLSSIDSFSSLSSIISTSLLCSPFLSYDLISPFDSLTGRSETASHMGSISPLCESLIHPIVGRRSSGPLSFPDIQAGRYRPIEPPKVRQSRDRSAISVPTTTRPFFPHYMPQTPHFLHNARNPPLLYPDP